MNDSIKNILKFARVAEGTTEEDIYKDFENFINSDTEITFYTANPKQKTEIKKEDIYKVMNELKFKIVIDEMKEGKIFLSFRREGNLYFFPQDKGKYIIT